mmetsp:Transcript_3855/g.9826  ORF Transcript_3855/g.9826 Transcript_3855/m.9826 type:complete len:643 (-) Transcript_3855:255-2183(-)|eukprot:CAMPEP_0117534264 /NCGR_PEP_ID=MMETSP0784-20121206/40319_1 /TAXON_ID=39447 /ORGANISM="" /LENGTH=642 /DNA_ID=CAMNT_0005330733 /DNA_START=16 /DNA_END=1944 /DNA_ORIENTATION=+
MLEHLKRLAPGFFGESAPDGFAVEFQYEDLLAATGDFARENKLGAGSSGEVYRGRLSGGDEVAVKVLSEAEGQSSFHEELRVLSRLQHPNLVALVGWGQHRSDGDKKFLVYELLPGGDIGRLLYQCKLGRRRFPWQQRLRVALDASRGLAHMVNGQPKAFHRDIKSSNILLAANGIAKIADFGLAGVIKDAGQSRLNVDDVSGTPGYMCPEYVRTGEVTEQSEAYSFGMVLLELLLNELPARMGPAGDIVYPILEAVQPSAPEACERLFARLDLVAGWTNPQLKDFAQLALRCVQERPTQRPRFNDIVSDLQTICDSCLQGRVVAASSPVAPPDGLADQAGYAEPPGTLAVAQRHGSFDAAGLHPARAYVIAERSKTLDGGVSFYNVAPEASEGKFGPQVEAKRPPSAQGDTVLRRSSEPYLPTRQHSKPLSICAQASAPLLVLQPNDVAAGAVAAGTTSPVSANRARGVAPIAAAGATSPVSANGARGAATGVAAGATSLVSARSSRAVLQCVHAEGLEPSRLSMMACSIVLPAKGDTMDLGRQLQPGLFEQLLAAQPRWLGYISRVHCRLQMDEASSRDEPKLRIGNLSANVVYVCGRPLARGRSETMPRGGTLEFAAKVGAQQTHFLKFRLFTSPDAAF